MAYTIWTTGACNLRCQYCYEGLNKPNIHMTEEVAENVVNFIITDYRVEEELLVNFHGGEPFLNYDIMKFLIIKLEQAYSTKIKTIFSVTTNATLLNEEILDFITQHNIELTLSIDGAKHTHDKIRIFSDGKGSHDLVMKNAKMLNEKKLLLRIRMTINPNTVRDLCSNVEYLLEKGFKFIVPAINAYDKEWDDENLDYLKKEILKLKKIHNQYPESSIGLLEKLNYCGPQCNGGINSKHIYFDGSLFPCLVSCGHGDFKIGDVFSGINNEKHKNILSYSVFDNKTCSGCDLKYFCSASRCKIINKIKTGDYLLPSLVDCNYTNLIYELNGVNLQM